MNLEVINLSSYRLVWASFTFGSLGGLLDNGLGCDDLHTALPRLLDVKVVRVREL